MEAANPFVYPDFTQDVQGPRPDLRVRKDRAYTRPTASSRPFRPQRKDLRPEEVPGGPPWVFSGEFR
jgi:hypothetical protein